ncbi:MAG: dTDP-4-dehydrorhamnose reductase, partial [Alistipes sp.]|nr:dTDP-4-dehydrorhamnose reductase [Alistipes sp.]
DVVAKFENEHPHWVINAAAYTAVDRAEEEPEKAKLLNATAVAILAEESARQQAGFVQISTDYVFDGKGTAPLTEEMQPAPEGVYGRTKYEGELAATRNPHHLILRTSWLYSAYGNNFVKTMRRLGAEREEIGVVADQWGSPTLADDLAEAIMTAIVKADHGAKVWGLYHFSDEGSTCWADFAQQILLHSGLSCRVKHLSTEEYGAKAPRPAFSVLSKEKYYRTFGRSIPEWEDSLEQLIHRMDDPSTPTNHA